MRIFDDGMGCRIAYDVYGTHGETVILMHGGFGTGHSHFANEIPLLAHHHIVYVVDFPGYGQSAPPSRRYGVDFYQRDAHDMLTFIRGLHLGPVHLVGFSDGGEVAMLMAIAAPDLIKSIVQWGACGKIPDSVTIDHWLPVSAWGPEMASLRDDIIRLHGEAQLVSMVEGYYHALKAINARGGDIALSHVHHIQCHVTIIHGDADGFAPTALVRDLATRIPSCALHVIPDADHFVQHDAPAELHHLLMSVL